MPLHTVGVTLKGDASDFNRAILGAAATTKAFSKELDGSTDRATMFTQSVLALGPALVPIAAVGVPALAGLSNQLGFAAAGAGVAALAFQGVGDALKATNDYAIDPSAANLTKMNEALAKIGPAGRDFVAFLQELRPKLQGLQDLAQAGLLPGVEDGIRDLMTLMPNVERIVATISTTMGDLFAEAGSNLADPRWQEFFGFLETEARPTLLALGRGVGNLVEGFANLWMAFAPLSDQFSKSFLQMSRDFAAWTDGLDQTEGFQEFLAYIEQNGPRVWDALSAIGDALLQIVEAAAPVGSAALPVITALSKVIGTIADSELGPVVIGIVSLTSALSRLKALGTTMNTSAIGTLFGKSALGGGLSNIKSVAAATDELRIAQSRLADSARSTVAAQSALIPVKAKRQELTSYMTSLQGVQEAEKGLAAATKERNRQFKAAGIGIASMAFVMSDFDDKLGLTNTAMGAMIGSAIGPWGTAIGAAGGAVIDLTHQTSDAEAAVKSFQMAFSEQKSLAGQESVIAAMKERLRITKELASKGGILESALDEEAKKLEAGLKPLEAQHKATQRAADDQKLAEAGLADSMRGASDETRDETLALLDNIATKNRAVDAAESMFSAETNYRRALKDAQEQAKKTNAGIDGNSEAALKNRDMLDGLASAWNRQADAGGKTTAQMRKAQAAFIRVAEDMGVGSERAKQLAEDLFHIPSPKPKVTLQGVGAAYTQIANLKSLLKGIKDEEVIVHVRKAIESGGGRGHQLATSADGNIFDFYANGGMRENHIAQIAPAGAWRVWAEPETGGEAYIPLADSKKPRSLDIWAETGKRLGVEGFADGAVRVQQFAGGGPAQAATISPTSMTATLTGGRIEIGKDGFGRLIDSRIKVHLAGDTNFAAGNRRAGRKS